MSSPRAADGENILIVDDTPANLRLLSRMLSERGYRVRAVTSGSRALESADLSPPDLVLLDIKMPEMDGYEVCERLRAVPHTRDVPVIFISALDDLQDKVRAFSVGGVDYVTKPFQVEEVLARVQTHLALRRLRQQLEIANMRMRRELDLAGAVQASFLPTSLPDLPGWDVAVALKPARQTSGDFYDLHILPNGRLGFLVADVADKGVGAALYMALIWSLIRTYAAQYAGRPEAVLSAVNRRILEDTHSQEFVSVFYGTLDPSRGLLAYCNAGHHPPLLFSASQNDGAQALHRTGMVLGVSSDDTWGRETVQLAPGDVLLLYTDGITDAANPRGAFFGPDRLASTVRKSLGLSAEGIQSALLRAVREYVAGAVQFDDMALMVLVRQA